MIEFQKISAQLEALGIRVTPVYSSGKTQRYGDGQTYPYSTHSDLYTQAVHIAAILDNLVLIDYDGNKPNANTVSLLELEKALGVPLPPVFQTNAEGNSLHFIYQSDTPGLKHSCDGHWLAGVDIKRGNQLVHIKEGKFQNFDTLTSPPPAPQTIIDALTERTIPDRAVEYKPFTGQADPQALTAFNADVELFAQMMEGEDGGRNNKLNSLALQWLSIAYSGDLDPHYVESQLREAAADNGCEGVDSTIASALRKASTQPRHYKVDIATLFAADAPATTESKTIIETIRSDAGLDGSVDRLCSMVKNTPMSNENRGELVSILEEQFKLVGKKQTRADLKKWCTPDKPISTDLIQPPQLCNFRDLVIKPIQALDGIHNRNAAFLFETNFHRNLRRCGKELYWWNGRQWESVDNEELNAKVIDAFRGNDFGKSSNITGTEKLIPGTAESIYDLGGADKRVFFLNGVFHLDGSFQPHDADNKNITTLSVEYNSNNRHHPHWSKFLQDIFGHEPERILLLQEIMGWFLTNDYLGIERAIVFDGVSRAGKGVIGKLLMNILGDAHTPMKLEDIIEKRKLIDMRNSNVAIDLEGSQPNIANISLIGTEFKKISANEDVSVPLMYHQKTWTGPLNCKILVCCNKIPSFYDDSGATSERWLILKFDKSFKDCQDFTLKDKINSEAQAITMWALDGLIRLNNNNGIFTLPQSTIDAANLALRISSPLEDFIQERIELDIESKCHSRLVWDSYKSWCRETNTKPSTRVQFLRSLERTLEDKGIKYKPSVRIDGEITSGFIGISLKDCTQGVTNVTPITRTAKKFSEQ